ncbi:MAG TPA: hypothetical protein VJL84_01900 [Kiloniellales bacterium]|nr:hypothetical protein [Kiloniellales bacterium]
MAASLLSGCLNHGKSLPQADQALASGLPPTPEQFTYCSDHGCEIQHPVSLTAADWAGIVEPLAGPAGDGAAERAAVAEVVGRFERVVGPRTGTANDPAGTGILAPVGDLDCVDEAVNTTRLLIMLDDAGLLSFHTAGRPIHRAFVGNSRTHMTAVLHEKGGVGWAVDSWFHDSGSPAEVVELSRWLDGWEP